jgi:hypothetical protein
MEKIIIEGSGYDGGFNVRQGDKYNTCLSYEEMLGIITALTMNEDIANHLCGYMQTKEEWIRRDIAYGKAKADFKRDFGDDIPDVPFEDKSDV